jgi:hypothetical protein
MSSIDELKRAAVTTTLDAMSGHAAPNLIADFASMLGDARHPELGYASEFELTTYTNAIKAERQCKGAPLTGAEVEGIAGRPEGMNLGIPRMARMISKQIDRTPQHTGPDHKSYCALKAAGGGGAVGGAPVVATTAKFAP